MININYDSGYFTDIYIYGGLLHNLNNYDLSRGTITFVFFPLNADGTVGYPAWVTDSASGTKFDFSMYPTYLRINCNRSYWINWWNMVEPKTEQLFMIRAVLCTSSTNETLFEVYEKVNLYKEQIWPLDGISTTSNKFFYP